jgi:histidinol-phosphate aminotransferase
MTFVTPKLASFRQMPFQGGTGLLAGRVQTAVRRVLCKMELVPLVPPYIESLQPYEAGRTVESVRKQYGLSHIAKLASNENPLGASPKAIEAMTRALGGLHLYPNGGLDLREVLAGEYELKVENVIAGSGSEGIMSNIIRAFLCDEDEVLTTEAAFIGFQVLARSRGVRYRTVPYRDWHYDLPALSAQINANTKIVYLANPNNPTGTIFTKSQFDEFYKHVPERVLIILDEAYFEYAKDNPRYPDSMHYRYDNVITLRTFSKIYGLAGVRIGYGFAHEELIRNLLKVKLPFEPSTPAQAAGIGALADKEFLHRSLELNARGLVYLARALQEIGLTVVPSEANFVMTVLPGERDANRIFEELLAQGVVVRPLKAFGLPNCLRISTGTDEDNRLCVEALKKSWRNYGANIGASRGG